jgi:hypothetical protein
MRGSPAASPLWNASTIVAGYEESWQRRVVVLRKLLPLLLMASQVGMPLHLILRRTRTIGLYLRNGIRIAFGQNPNFITVFEAVERQTPSESHASS